MSNSWETGLSFLKACGVAGGLPEGTVDVDFRPNTFSGCPLSNTVINVAFASSGTSMRGFSIADRTQNVQWVEVWLNFTRMSNINDSGEQMGIGWWRNGTDGLGNTGDTGSQLDIGLEIVSGGVRAIDLTKGASNVGATITVPRGWHHWSAIIDDTVDEFRVFIDNYLVATTSYTLGSAVSYSSWTRTPLVHMAEGMVQGSLEAAWDLGADADPDPATFDYPESLTAQFSDYSSFSHLPCIMGPGALYDSGIATDPRTQMQASVDNRTIGTWDHVNNIEPDSCWIWCYPEFRGGTPRWDFNPRHIYRGASDYFPGCAVPVATDDGLFEIGGYPTELGRLGPFVGSPLLSAITPQTLSLYGQEEDKTATTRTTSVAAKTGLRGWYGFGLDPFFLRGGNASAAL